MKNAQKFTQPLVLGRLSADPSGAVAGAIYYNTTSNAFRVYNGTAWQPVVSGTVNLSGYLKADGSVPLTGTLNANGQRITGLPNTMGDVSDAVSYSAMASAMSAESSNVINTIVTNYLPNYLPLAGGTMSGGINMNGNQLTGVLPPVNMDDAANKGYVDSAISGLSATYIPLSEKGAANGVATLGADGKLPSSQVPAIAITDTFVVASEAAMLALSTAEQGDVAVRTDLNKSFILVSGSPATLSNWQELLTPTDVVQSVNGQTGSVVLTTDNVNEGATNKYFTDTRAKTAAVVDSMAGTQTDQAPSVSSVKTYVASEIAAIPAVDLSPYLKKDGSVPLTAAWDVGANEITGASNLKTAKSTLGTSSVDIVSEIGVRRSVSATGDVLITETRTLTSQESGGSHGFELGYALESIQGIRIGRIMATYTSTDGVSFVDNYTETAAMDCTLSVIYEPGTSTIIVTGNKNAGPAFTMRAKLTRYIS